MRVFHPRPGAKTTPAMARDFDIPVDEDVVIGARWFVFDESWPTILFFHGNGEIVSDYDDIAPAYKNVKLNLFIADYRGYGWSTGHPSFRNYYSDALTIADFFLEQIGPRAPAPLIMGRSLGSGPASVIATRKSERFAGLILESGFGDLLPLMELFQIDLGEHAKAVQSAFSNHLKLEKLKLPALILHGQFDNLIPPVAAKQNFAHIPHDKKTLKILVGVGHNDIFRQFQEYLAAIDTFNRSVRER